MKFHFLQGLWYRALVDMKAAEVERCMHEHHMDVCGVIRGVLDIDVFEDEGRAIANSERS